MKVMTAITTMLATSLRMETMAMTATGCLPDE
jgi:hypothetical protein